MLKINVETNDVILLFTLIDKYFFDFLSISFYNFYIVKIVNRRFKYLYIGYILINKI